MSGGAKSKTDNDVNDVNDNLCAPAKKSIDGTCFTLEQLIDMAKAINKSGLGEININNDKKSLLEQITKTFDSVCNGDQMCLTKQQFMSLIDASVRHDIKTNTLKPIGPTQSTEWLSTKNIDDICKQLVAIHPDFNFLGAVPIDCGELDYCSTYDLNFDDLDKNYKKLGIIYNLDDHTQPGSHWVALYIDMPEGNAYYFDSMGGEPPNRVKKLLSKFESYCKNHNIKPNIKINTVRHQYDKSECGIYSINFIDRLLRGESYDHIVNNITDFESINSCRNKYFYNKVSPYPIAEVC
jgi:hypothetical protein